jgi:hypothetical protein
MDELVCRDCGDTKAATDFRPRQAGGATRTSQCRACHCLAEKLRREAKRSRQHRQAVNRQLARLKQAKSARQIGAVCEELIRCFGGLEGAVICRPSEGRVCRSSALGSCPKACAPLRGGSAGLQPDVGRGVGGHSCVVPIASSDHTRRKGLFTCVPLSFRTYHTVMTS